jgi:hypothetical protein
MAAGRRVGADMESMEQALRKAAKGGHFGTVVTETGVVAKAADEIKTLRQSNSFLIMMLWILVNRSDEPVVIEPRERAEFDRVRAALDWHAEPSSGAITLKATLRDAG